MVRAELPIVMFTRLLILMLDCFWHRLVNDLRSNNWYLCIINRSYFFAVLHNIFFLLHVLRASVLYFF